MKVVPLRSRSAHAALFAAALAGLICSACSSQPTRIDPTITLTNPIDRGVRLLGAWVTETSGNQALGSFFLLRVRMISDSGAHGVTVTVALSDQRWSTTTYLAAESAGEADLVLPSNREYWTQDALALVVREGNHVLASSGMVATRPLDDESNEAGLAEPVPVSNFIAIGMHQKCPAGWRRISEDSMEILGRYRECLDSTPVIAAPNLRWLSRPGINAWVRAGGLLIVPGNSHWTPLGDGAVVMAPSSWLKDQRFIDRMVLTTHSNLSLHNDSANRYADHPPVFGSVPDPGAFPQSDVPTSALAVMLGLYLLLLLPGSYFLLRKMRRKEMAWVMAPALALAFSAGITALCFALKGGSTVVGRVSVIEETSPGVYLANDYVSIFSPRNMAGSLILPAGSLPSLLPTPYSSRQWHPERNELGVLETPQATFVDDLPLSQWTSRSIASTGSPPIRGAITAAIYRRNGGWTASIKNNSSLHLEECRAWTGDGWLMIGDLTPGQAKTVSGPLRKPLVDENAPRGRSFGDRVRQDELAWLLIHTSREHLFFEGWTRQPLQAAIVPGVSKYDDESVIVTPLAVVRGPDGLAAPLDLAPVVSLDDNNGDVGYPQSGAGGYPGGGGGYPGGDGGRYAQTGAAGNSTIADYGLKGVHLPEAIHPALDTLTFSTRKWNDQSASSRQDLVRCSVWNPAARRWDLALRVDARGRIFRKQFRLANYISGPPGAVATNPMLYLKATGNSDYLYPKIESLTPTSEKVIVFLGES